MSLKLFLFTLTIIAASVAEIIKFQPCPKRSPDEKSNCVINQAIVDPCPQAATGEACKLKRGKVASILVDFTPDFTCTAVKNRAYWHTFLTDLPFVGMDTDGCKYVNCPLKTGEVNNYNYTLNLAKSLPTGPYDVMWKIWDDSDQENHLCCFVFKLKLT